MQITDIHTHIYPDEIALKATNSVREFYQIGLDGEMDGTVNMLLRRGDAFVQAAKEADLKMTPFSAGFFCVIPCENPDAVCEELQKDNIFVLALAKGLRVSIASVSEAKCAAMPAKIKAAITKING